jgi:hypothetical protein
VCLIYCIYFFFFKVCRICPTIWFL